MKQTGQELYRKALRRIPGGTQLLSKRPELFLPEQWPSYYSRAKGAEVWDLDGRKFTDMSYMGIGACVIGYADDDVDQAVKSAIDAGQMTTLNCPEEIELADLLCELHPWAEHGPLHARGWRSSFCRRANCARENRKRSRGVLRLSRLARLVSRRESLSKRTHSAVICLQVSSPAACRVNCAARPCRFTSIKSKSSNRCSEIAAKSLPRSSSSPCETSIPNRFSGTDQRDRGRDWRGADLRRSDFGLSSESRAECILSTA